MEDYLFAILAFFLLLALVFFVPMKFTKLGKWLVPSIAFMVSVLGIYILELLTLWHSILAMTLLLLLTALLLQRLPLFISTNNNTVSNKQLKQEYTDIKETRSNYGG